MKFEFKEEVPTNIKDIKKEANTKDDANIRLNSVSELGKWKCTQSIDILWRLMANDKVFKVQEQAFLRLQAFGEDVRLPRKKKGKLIKDIDKKVNKILNSLSFTVSFEDFKKLFENKNPEEYDIYKHDKGNKFDNWLKNIIKNMSAESRNKISDL